MIPNASTPLSNTASLSDHQFVRSGFVRYFFPGMATFFIVLAIVGFTPSYQMVYNGSAQLHWFAHVHGAIMSSWLILFLTQSILVAKGNLRFHKQLGLFAVGLGAIVFVSLIAAGVRARLFYAPPLLDFTWDILLIEMYGFTLFGLFFTWGILVRKNTAAHKRLVFLATAVLLQAAVDRTRFLPFMDFGFFVRFVYLDVLLIAPLFIYDFVTLRRIHKITMIGAVIFIVVQSLASMTVGSLAWHKFWFNLYAPFVEQVVEVKLADAQIQPLLGEYGDKNWRMQIFSDSGKVYLKLPDTPKFEINSSSENEWFMKTTVWKVSFIRDINGDVVKLINQQPNVTWEVMRYKEP